MRLRAAALACVLVCACPPAPAAAAEVSAAQPRALAADAQRDPAALARSAEGTGPGASAASAPAARARERAREILAQRRFQPSSVPAPLRGLRERVGDGVRQLGRPFQKAFEWIAGWLPGGGSLLWVLIAALVLGGAGVLATRAGARRRLAAGGGSQDGEARVRVTSAHLRREAERAERAGDLDAALRLRFRAGLLELDSRELIELRPALTNRELLREVPSETLAGLVDGFEAVAYGGKPAQAGDVRSARDGWPRVPEEAGKR